MMEKVNNINILLYKIFLFLLCFPVEIVERGFVKLQALWRGYAARQRYQKLVRENAYRKKVAKELLETERVYVENLDACITVNDLSIYANIFM